jgi:hypothetical protein
MTLVKKTLLKIDGEHGTEWCTADVMIHVTGSQDGVPFVVPGTLKPVDLESLPVKAQAKLAVLGEQAEKANDAEIENPTLTMTPAMEQPKNMKDGRSKSNKPKQQPTVPKVQSEILACYLGGEQLSLWFDKDGDLCVEGPPEAQAKIEAFVSLYRAVLNGNDELLENLEPLGDKHRSMKKFAVLDLVVDVQVSRENPGEEIEVTPEQIEKRVRVHQKLFQKD